MRGAHSPTFVHGISRYHLGTLNFYFYLEMKRSLCTSFLRWCEQRPAGESGLSPLSPSSLCNVSEGHVVSTPAATSKDCVSRSPVGKWDSHTYLTVTSCPHHPWVLMKNWKLTVQSHLEATRRHHLLSL